jgi:hypothetical protein
LFLAGTDAAVAHGGRDARHNGCPYPPGVRPSGICFNFLDRANVAELVDALDLGSSGATRESSSLSIRTKRSTPGRIAATCGRARIASTGQNRYH